MYAKLRYWPRFWKCQTIICGWRGFCVPSWTHEFVPELTHLCQSDVMIWNHSNHKILPHMVTIRKKLIMMTSSMEAFSPLLAICAGNSPVTGEFPAQRPVTRSFDVFLDLRLNKRLSKQSKRRWLETPSRTLWHRCYALVPDKTPQCSISLHIVERVWGQVSYQHKTTIISFEFNHRLHML